MSITSMQGSRLKKLRRLQTLYGKLKKYGLDLNSLEDLSTFPQKINEGDLRRQTYENNPNFVNFSEYVIKDELGNPVDLAAHHIEWHNFIERNRKLNRQRLCILAPRGFAKTTVCVIARLLWELPKNINQRVKIISNRDDFAQKRVVTIGHYITLDRQFKDVFGKEIIPSSFGSWGMTQLFIQRDSLSIDPTVEGCGILTTGTGSRSDFLLVDDPVDYDNSVASNATRSKVIEQFQNVWMQTISPNAWILMVATPWHKRDLIHELLTISNWTFLIQRVSDDLTHLEQIEHTPGLGLPSRIDKLFEVLPIKKLPLWGVWSKNKLESKLSEIKRYAFNRAYRMNCYMSADNKMFDRTWFRLIQVPRSSDIKIRCWDLASTEEGEGSDPDYTASSKLSYLDGRFCIEHQIAFRKGTHDTEEMIKQFAQTDGPDTVIVIEEEPGSSGKYTVDHFRTVLAGYAVYPFRPTKSKTIRAVLFQSHAEAGNIDVVNSSWTEDFFEELEAFPDGEHDDRVDSLSAAFEFIASRFLQKDSDVGGSRAVVV